MTNSDIGGSGGSRRPTIQHQADDRNFVVIDLEPCRPPGSGDVCATSSVVRNKVKYQESVRKIQEIHRRLSVESTGTPAESAKGSDEMAQLLSSLEETNLQNENTIRHLQRQLVDLTNERDAAREDAERLKKLSDDYRNKRESEIHQERRGFVRVTHKHKKELHKWKRRVNKLGKRCKQMECDLKERQGLPTCAPLDSIAFEKRRVVDGVLSDKFRCDATDEDDEILSEDHAEARARAEELLSLTEERSTASKKLDNELVVSSSNSVQQDTATTDTGSSSGGDTDHGNFCERPDQIEGSLDLRSEDGLEVRSTEGRSNVSKKLEGTLLASSSESVKQDAAAVATGGGDTDHGNFREELDRIESSLEARLEDFKWIGLESRVAAVVMALSSPDAKLERDQTLAVIKDMRAESIFLRRSAGDTMRLASDVSEKMGSAMRAHETIVEKYKGHLAMLRKGLDRAVSSNEEASATLHSYKYQNEVLRAALKDSNDIEEYYEQVLMNLNEEKEQACRQLEEDARNAYRACEVLQLEIDLHRQTLEQSHKGSDGAKMYDHQAMADRQKKSSRSNASREDMLVFI